MPNGQTPGHKCQVERPVAIDGGTTCREASPTPTPVGVVSGSGVSSSTLLATARRPAQAIQSASISIGAETTWDSAIRAVYNSGAEAIRQQAQELLQTGQMTAEQAKIWSNGQRNALMQACRDKSSPLGKAIAEAIKPKPKSVADLEQLGKSAEGIIESAGKTNPYVNRVAVGFRFAGPALLVIGLSFSAYHIATAPENERWHVTAQEAGIWSGALAGGWAGGRGGAVAGGAICTFVEPGGGTAICGAVGGVVGTLGGAILGGWAGSKAGDYVYRSLAAPQSSGG